MPRFPRRRLVLPPRPAAGAIVLRRSREAALERVALASAVLAALTASGFAGYTISSQDRPYVVQAVLPAQAGPFVWKKSLAEGRRREQGESRPGAEPRLDPDFDPLVTGSLPDRPVAARPAERPAPARAGLYTLRSVSGGTARLEAGDGIREVGVGAMLPGAGRVLAIRDTGAGWIVITSETIIGPRRL